MTRLSYLLPFLAFLACQPVKPQAPDATPPSGPAATPPADRLPDAPSGWDIVQFQLPGEELRAVANDQAFITFRGTQLGGNSGCNSFGGDVDRLSPARDTLYLPGVMATRMFCQPVQAQEQALFQLLNGPVLVERPLPDELILRRDGIRFLLRRNDGRLKN